MAPLVANVDGLVPPAFDIPTEIRLIGGSVESIPIKDIEEYVIVECTDGRAWREALLLSSQVDIGIGDGMLTSAFQC